MTLCEGQKVMVAGDEVIGLRRQQRSEHGNIGRIANGVAGKGLRFDEIDLDSQNVGEVGEVDGPPLQAVIEAGQLSSSRMWRDSTTSRVPCRQAPTMRPGMLAG